MTNELFSFIRSLQNDRFIVEKPGIPDGVFDMSEILKGLKEISRHGRFLNSDVDYDHGRAIADLLSCLCTETPDGKRLEHVIMCLSIVLICVLDAAVEVNQNTCAEELLMMAIGPDALTDLMSEFKNVPYMFNDEGALQVNFAALTLFSRVRPITQRKLRAFTERHYLETLPFLFEEESEMQKSSERDDKTRATRPYVPTSEEIQDMTMDRLEGFDEFYDYFWGHHYKWYSEGAALEDLPNMPDEGLNDE